MSEDAYTCPGDEELPEEEGKRLNKIMAASNVSSSFSFISCLRRLFLFVLALADQIFLSLFFFVAAMHVRAARVSIDFS